MCQLDQEIGSLKIEKPIRAWKVFKVRYKEVWSARRSEWMARIYRPIKRLRSLAFDNNRGWKVGVWREADGVPVQKTCVNCGVANPAGNRLGFYVFKTKEEAEDQCALGQIVRAVRIKGVVVERGNGYRAQFCRLGA